MDGQGCKSLGGTLGESNIAKRRLASCRQDVVDGVRNVVKCKLVNGEVPESVVCGRIFDMLLRILVSSVVSELRHISMLTV